MVIDISSSYQGVLHRDMDTNRSQDGGQYLGWDCCTTCTIVSPTIMATGGSESHGFSDPTHHSRNNDGGASIKREDLIIELDIYV